MYNPIITPQQLQLDHFQETFELIFFTIMSESSESRQLLLLQDL